MLSEGGLEVRPRRLPPSPPPDHVRIAIVRAGICRTDLAVASEAIAVERPRVLGHEAAGRVAAVGSPSDAVDGAGIVGRRVGVDPRVAGGFLGVSVNGAFSTLVDLPVANVVPLGAEVSWSRAAYLEPVAAALGAFAELPAGGRGCILGDNRIAELTHLLAARLGFADTVWVREPGALNRDAFDWAIESDPGLIHAAIQAVVPGGTIVLKSRPARPVALDLRTVVERRLSLRGCPYGCFHHAAALIADPSLELEPLFGEVFALEAFPDAFAAARRSERRKLFLRLSEDA